MTEQTRDLIQKVCEVIENSRIPVQDLDLYGELLNLATEPDSQLSFSTLHHLGDRLSTISNILESQRTILQSAIDTYNYSEA